MIELISLFNKGLKMSKAQSLRHKGVWLEFINTIILSSYLNFDYLFFIANNTGFPFIARNTENGQRNMLNYTIGMQSVKS